MRCILFTGILALLILATGCLDLDNGMTLNKDGSGTFSITYGMADKVLARMRTMVDLHEELATASAGGKKEEPELLRPNPFTMDQKKLENEFKKYEQHGVKLESITQCSREGWQYTTLEIGFKSLSNLAKTDFFSDQAFVLFFPSPVIALTKTKKGNYLFDLSAPEGERREETESALTNEETRELVDPLLEGFKIRFGISVPGKIISTNGTRDKERPATASWIYDYAEDRKAVIKVQEEHMQVIFSGKGLALAEVLSRPK